jgi:hypothetical protein
MSFRFDMRNKTPQQQAIVRARDERDKILRKESEKRRQQEHNNQDKDKPIKSTNYCDIWKRVILEMDSGGVAAIELITVKELKREEVRFAYYKKNPDGSLRFIPRPLDLTPSDLNILLTKAREEGIIS